MKGCNLSMENTNKKNAFCKIVDFFRPMTEYTVKEDCRVSLSLLENENASEPCCACEFTEKKKINLFRVLALAGMMVTLVCLVLSVCSCIKKIK